MRSVLFFLSLVVISYVCIRLFFSNAEPEKQPPTSLIQFPAHSLELVEIQRADTSFSLQRSNGEWLITYQNITMPAQSSAVQPLIQALCTIQASDLKKTKRKVFTADRSSLHIELSGQGHRETYHLQTDETGCWNWLAIDEVEENLWFPLESSLCLGPHLRLVNLLPPSILTKEASQFPFILAILEGDSLWFNQDSISHPFVWLKNEATFRDQMQRIADPQCQQQRRAFLGRVELLAVDSLPEISLRVYGDSLAAYPLYLSSSDNPGLCFRLDSIHPLPLWLGYWAEEKKLPSSTEAF